MAYTITLNSDSDKLVNGKTLILNSTLTVDDDTDTYSYAWYVDDVVQDGHTGESFIYSPTKDTTEAGQHVIKVIVTGAASGEVSDSKTITVIAEVEISIGDPTGTLKVGNTIQMVASVQNLPDGASSVYTWFKDGVEVVGMSTATYSESVAKSGIASYTVKIAFTSTDYTGSVTSTVRSVTLAKGTQEITGTTATETFQVVKDEAGALFEAFTTGKLDAAVLTYAWYKNGVVIPGQTTKTYTFVGTEIGDAAIHCVITSTLAEYDTKVINTTPITVDVIGRMTITAALSPSTATLQNSESQTVTVNMTGVPSGSTSAYKWYVNNSPVSGSTNTFVVNKTYGVGSLNVRCDVTVTNADYVTGTATGNGTYTINNLISSVLTVNPQAKTVNVGEPLEITAVLTPPPPQDSTVKYTWKSNGTIVGNSQSYTVDTREVSTTTYTIDVEISLSGYDTYASSSNSHISVIAVVPEGESPYVHPLPWRNSAYIWCGYWVLDEIQRMTTDGLNWKTDTSGDWYFHRYVLSSLMDEYSELDVQESRNGYIINREKLESGIFYPYFKYS